MLLGTGDALLKKRKDIGPKASIAVAFDAFEVLTSSWIEAFKS